jgi:hypothetical protein
MPAPLRPSGQPPPAVQRESDRPLEVRRDHLAPRRRQPIERREPGRVRARQPPVDLGLVDVEFRAQVLERRQQRRPVHAHLREHGRVGQPDARGDPLYGVDPRREERGGEGDFAGNGLAEPEVLELTEAQRAEIDRRFDAHRASNDTIPWETLRRELPHGD